MNDITNTSYDILDLLSNIKSELSVKTDSLIENITIQNKSKAKLIVLANIESVQGLIQAYNNLLNSKNYSILNEELIIIPN